MPPVKDLDKTAEKWARVAQGAQAEYTAGVEAPRKSWSAQTAAAESNYEMGVQAAISRKAFGKGVKKAGDTKWSTNTLAKGPARWAQGINLAQDAYKEGFAPFRAVIVALNLPPRGPKGDPKNINRVAALAKALHDEKLKRAGV